MTSSRLYALPCALLLLINLIADRSSGQSDRYYSSLSTIRFLSLVGMMHFFIALSVLMNSITGLSTSRLNKHYSPFPNSRFSPVSGMMHYSIALLLLISTNRMSEPAPPKLYSSNPKTIASRKRKKNWGEIEIKMYNARTADSTAVSKAKARLKQTAV